jgi:ribonuclease HII
MEKRYWAEVLLKKVSPSLKEEVSLRKQGFYFIAGIDEAGRGPLAGPVVAAAVILPAYRSRNGWRRKINDSKKLTEHQRLALYSIIKREALAVGVGIIPPHQIDSIGILVATRLAMKEAIAKLNPPPQYLLIDHLLLPDISLPQKGITKGDALCFSISCASIVAKVTRDTIMRELDSRFPEYGLAQHKGYGTSKHIECLRRLGPTPIHRFSFRPVMECRVIKNEA